MRSDNTISETGDGRAPRAAGRSFLRDLLFRLAAVLLVVLLFAALELALRLFDVGRPTDNADPLQGFNQQFPLFEPQGNVYRTVRAREAAFQAQEFPIAKPTNGFRIFCFGGSTVYGHPYLADTAFPKWLELELNGSDLSRSYQVINCGGISYASYRLAPRVKEVLHYQPDLIILATGHNEFLEDRRYHAIKERPAAWAKFQNAAYASRIVNLARRWFTERTAPASLEALADRGSQLPPEVRARLDAASGYASYHRDDAWRENVFAQFDESVRDIVASCRAAGVPILLVKLGSNLRDCPPFKSEHRAELSPEAEREWQQAFDTATALETNAPEQALGLFQKAETIDREYALLDYRIARMLDRLGRMPEALTYYRKARDEDICPLRIIQPMVQLLDRIAGQTGTPLLDAERLLAAESFDSIPGFECYLDHVHPTLGGHQRIGRALAAQMREGGLVRPQAVWPEPNRRETYQRHFAQLRPTYLSEGQQRVNWLENWARRQRLLEETLPQDARGYIRLGIRQLDLGDELRAGYTFAKAIKLDPKSAEAIRDHLRELVAQGRPACAAGLERLLFGNAPVLDRQ